MIGIGDMELKTTGYASFAVTLDEMTPGAVQAILRQAYRTLDADPKYIFLSPEDYKMLDDAVYLGTTCIYTSEAEREARHAFRWINQVTGMLLWCIRLPELVPHTIIIGFLKVRVGDAKKQGKIETE